MWDGGLKDFDEFGTSGAPETLALDGLIRSYRGLGLEWKKALCDGLEVAICLLKYGGVNLNLVTLNVDLVSLSITSYFYWASKPDFSGKYPFSN